MELDIIVIKYCVHGRNPDGSTNYNDKTIIHTNYFTREQYRRYKWFITLRAAHFQIQYPRNLISTIHSFIDSESLLNVEAASLRHPVTRLRSARRMVTKICNAMNKYKENYNSTIFEPNAEDTDEWKKAASKLEHYRQEVINSEQEIKDLQESELKNGR